MGFFFPFFGLMKGGVTYLMGGKLSTKVRKGCNGACLVPSSLHFNSQKCIMLCIQISIELIATLALMSNFGSCVFLLSLPLIGFTF